MDRPGRMELLLGLSEKNEEVEVIGVILAETAGEYEVVVAVNHNQIETKGRIAIRGLVRNGARVKIDALVKIEKQAQGSDDFMEIKCLVMDEMSSAVVSPNLEIEANEVRASHAATVGQISEEALFYLESRGISPVEAEKLIVNGFLSELVDRIEDENIKNKINYV